LRAWARLKRASSSSGSTPRAAGCRCGRLCRMLGTHLLGRSARGQIPLAEPGLAGRCGRRATMGGYSDAEKPSSKGLGSAPPSTNRTFLLGLDTCGCDSVKAR
jgi:hypothetical protein